MAAINLRHDGIETFQRSSAALEIDSALQLDASQTGIEWAIYEFGTNSYPLIAQIECAPNATDYWIGVADFAAGAWDLNDAPEGQPEARLLLDPQRHRSAAGNVYFAVIVHGANTVTVQRVSVLVREPPLAQLDLLGLTNKVTPGTKVSLSSHASEAQDGELVKFEWDLDGDGDFETVGADPSTILVAAPDPAGRITVGLRVTDDAGLTDIAQLPVSSSATYLASGADVLAGLEMVAGHPAIVWEEGRANDEVYEIKYKRASTEILFAGGGTEVIYTAEIDHGPPDFEVFNGLPAVAFSTEDGLNHTSSVLLARGNTDGTSWDTSEVYHETEQNLYARSLGVETLRAIDGHPALVFGLGSNSLDRNPHYSRSIDDQGAVWGEPVKVADSTLPWIGHSLQVFNGMPAFHGNSQGIYYAQDPHGQTWNQEPAIDLFGPAGPYSPRFKSLGGLPVATAQSFTFGLLEFFNHNQQLDFIAGNPAGLAWQNRATLFNGHVGGHTLVVVEGKPWILWGSWDRLLCRRALDAEGWEWGPIELIDIASASQPTPRYVVQVEAIGLPGGAGVAWVELGGAHYSLGSELYYDFVPVASP